MRFTVRLRRQAERELSAAASWYEQQREGLGQEFLDEFMAVHRRIENTPLMYSIVHRNTHRAVMNRFPFGVYFRIEDEEVTIVAVMHGSRNPNHWHGRTLQSVRIHAGRGPAPDGHLAAQSARRSTRP